MDLQKLLDDVSSASRLTRSDYHLTLGKLIDALDGAGNISVTFPDGAGVGREHSYRGYYSDLSFDDGKVETAAALARRLKAAAGSTYTGYKGGKYVMGLDTPLWRAPYGCGGDAIIDARIDGDKLVLVTKAVQ